VSRPRFAERMSRLGTESAFETLAQARRLEAEGRDVVHFEIGEPDFATPENISEAAIRSLRQGATHYTPASGIWEVRDATARYITRQTGVETGPEQVVLVPGSKNILYFTLLSLVEPGDEVLIPDPGYPIYSSLVSFVGAVPVSVPIREQNDFRLDVSELRSLVTERTRALILNTPANPTGGVLTREDCEAIAAVAIEHDLFVVSDEIYSRLVYEGSHVSPYSIEGMAERCVYMDGLSKAWAMCGWRLGFGAMPAALAERMDTLMINTASCAAAFTQWAAVEAFESPESDAAVRSMMAEFTERRDVVVEGLNAIPGIRCHRPAGAFYVFPNVEETGWDERDLQQALLEKAGVALLAGSAFGAGGRGFLRLSYANSVANLDRGIERIGNFLAGASPGGSPPGSAVPS
jgi:aspartate/methionine/tyrosine aminotransferase